MFYVHLLLTAVCCGMQELAHACPLMNDVMFIYKTLVSECVAGKFQFPSLIKAAAPSLQTRN